MTVADVLLSLRSRLRDRDGETWSDEELIDTINDSFYDIASDAEPVKKIVILKVNTDSEGVELPSDCGVVKLVYVNSKEVDINEIETALMSGTAGSVYVSGKTLFVIGGVRKDTEFRILYAAAVEIYEKSDTFPLPRYFKAPVLSKCMAIALLQKPSEKDFPNVQFLENVYDRALSRAITLHAKATNPRTHKSTFQKV